MTDPMIAAIAELTAQIDAASEKLDEAIWQAVQSGASIAEIARNYHSEISRQAVSQRYNQIKKRKESASE